MVGDVTRDVLTCLLSLKHSNYETWIDEESVLFMSGSSQLCKVFNLFLFKTAEEEELSKVDLVHNDDTSRMRSSAA